MEELVCESCGDLFCQDWQDAIGDDPRTLCRTCEELSIIEKHNNGEPKENY